MPEKAPSPRRAAYLRTVRREKRRVRIWQIALVAVLFAVWELSCRLGLSDGFLVSSPSRMVQTLWRLCASGELWHHAAVSIGETVLGFTAGTVLGTAVAVAMWWSDTAARILDPYLVVLNALPKTALGPIFIVWMGAGMGAIVTMTLAISLIVTILSMYTGFRTTDPEKLRLMRTLGADKRQILWLLVFPEFVFTAGEQEFYAERGFQNEPQRCKACRDARKNAARGPREYFTAVCAACGGEAKVPFEPKSDRPVYCSDCFAKMRENG